MGLRISDSVKLGAFRLRVSTPLNGRGRTWVSAGTRTPLGWLKLSAPAGGRKRRVK
jgi:hypothetical protein